MTHVYFVEAPEESNGK